jgi:hypothetical protein
MCYIAHSGGLLLFVSILTSIAHLQSNKFEQRGLESILTDSYSFKTTISCLPSALLKTNLTWSLQNFMYSWALYFFTKHGSHNTLTSIGLLWLKSVVFGTLDLVTNVENTSFTNLFEHLPPQLEIAGLLQSSTPSCEDSQVNPTWLKC